MNFYLHMVNAWSLAASVLNGTLDEDYPIMDKTKGRWEELTITSRESDEYDIPHSDYYYDYKRNDPNAKNPFTDPKDRARADYVVSGGSTDDLDWIAKSGGFEWTPGSSWPPSVPDDDELDYEVDSWENKFNPKTLSASSYYEDYMADIDDQRAHHFVHANSAYNDGWTKEFHKEQLEKMDYEPQRNHQYKYHEEEILKDIEEYVSRTYQGHYTGTKHEFRKVQTIDLMAARDIAAQFCQANILKYGSRYGSKDGRNKTDLLKVIHYAMLLLHFDGHYGEPSMPTGDFEQMP